MALVKEDCADWLITRNGRAKSGVSEFHRAIVVRSVLVDGEKLYSVDPPLALDGRKRKHEAIKRDVCDSARRLFQELFAKGVISQTDLQMSDAQLDELFGDAHILDKLLGKLTEVGQNSAHRRMVEITQHWWNNILGFQKLNIDAGRFLADADESSGLIVHVGGSGHLDVVDGQHKIDRGRVQVANHRPSNWSGDWDYSIGSTPAVDEHNDDDPTGGYAERADDHNDDGERGLTVGGRPIDGKATWQGEVIATKDEEWTGHED